MRVLFAFFLLSSIGYTTAEAATWSERVAQWAARLGIQQSKSSSGEAPSADLLDKPTLNRPPVLGEDLLSQLGRPLPTDTYGSIWEGPHEPGSEKVYFGNEKNRTPGWRSSEFDFNWTGETPITPAVAQIDLGEGYWWKVLDIAPIDPLGDDPGFNLSFRVNSVSEFINAARFLGNKLPFVDDPKTDIRFYLFEPTPGEFRPGYISYLSWKLGEEKVILDPEGVSLKEFHRVWRDKIPTSDIATNPGDGQYIFVARVSYWHHKYPQAGEGTAKAARTEGFNLAQFREKYLRILFRNLSQRGLFFAHQGTIAHFLERGGDMSDSKRLIGYVTREGALEQRDGYQRSTLDWARIAPPRESSLEGRGFSSFNTFLFGMGQFNGQPRQVIIEVLPNSLTLFIRVANSGHYNLAGIDHDVQNILRQLGQLPIPDLTATSGWIGGSKWKKAGVTFSPGETDVSANIGTLYQFAGINGGNIFVTPQRIVADVLALFARQSDIQLHLLDPSLIGLSAEDILNRIESKNGSAPWSGGNRCAREITKSRGY